MGKLFKCLANKFALGVQPSMLTQRGVRGQQVAIQSNLLNPNRSVFKQRAEPLRYFDGAFPQALLPVQDSGHQQQKCNCQNRGQDKRQFRDPSTVGDSARRSASSRYSSSSIDCYQGPRVVHLALAGILESDLRRACIPRRRRSIPCCSRAIRWLIFCSSSGNLCCCTGLSEVSCFTAATCALQLADRRVIRLQVVLGPGQKIPTITRFGILEQRDDLLQFADDLVGMRYPVVILSQAHD